MRTTCSAFRILASLAILPLQFAMGARSIDESQHPEKQELTKVDVKIDVSLVLVPVSVTDSTDRPIINLQKQDFVLLQDNERQNIEYFSREDVPISMGVLLDVSRSMAAKLAVEQAAVTEFVINANEGDDYFTIAFADHPKLISTSTQSIDTLRTSIDSLTANGNTAVFDAISDGLDQMKSAKRRRKALLVISDGGDNHSRHSLREITRLVQDSDIEVYAIDTFAPGPLNAVNDVLGNRWLNRITNATGGETLAVHSRQDIPAAAEKISEAIRSRYVLGYRPTRANGADRHKIRVLLASRNPSATHIHYKSSF